MSDKQIYSGKIKVFLNRNCDGYRSLSKLCNRIFIVKSLNRVLEPTNLQPMTTHRGLSRMKLRHCVAMTRSKKNKVISIFPSLEIKVRKKSCWKDPGLSRVTLVWWMTGNNVIVSWNRLRLYITSGHYTISELNCSNKFNFCRHLSWHQYIWGLNLCFG